MSKRGWNRRKRPSTTIDGRKAVQKLKKYRPKTIVKKKLRVFGIEISKKYSALAIAVASQWIVAQSGLPIELVTTFLWTIMGAAGSYILGQSWVDHSIAQADAAIHAPKSPTQSSESK